MPTAHVQLSVKVIRWLSPHILALGKVTKLITIDALKVLFLDQLINRFLDVGYLGGKAGFDLIDGLLYELDVLHFLSRFHDTHNSRLWATRISTSSVKNCVQVSYVEY